MAREIMEQLQPIGGKASSTPPAQTSSRSPEYLEAMDRLHAKAAYLDSALSMIWGEGFGSFDSFNEDLKENYIGMCSELAGEVRKLVATVDRLTR